MTNLRKYICSLLAVVVTASALAGPFLKHRRLAFQPNLGSAYSTEVLADSPIRYWPLTDTAGTVAIDSTGNDDADYVSGPTLGVAGPLAGETAVSFDGANDVVRTDVWGSFGSTMYSGAWSMEIWFKTSDVTTAKNTFMGVFGTGSDFTWQVNRNASDNYQQGYIRFWSQENGADSRSLEWNTSLTLSDDAWHHAVVTHAAGSGNVVLYVDGVSYGNGSTTIATINHANFSNIVHVGAMNFSGGADFFPGSLSNCAIYTSELSAARVLAHYRAPVPPLTTTYIEHDFTAFTTGDLSTVNPTTDVLGGGWLLSAANFNLQAANVGVSDTVGTSNTKVYADAGQEDVQVESTAVVDISSTNAARGGGWLLRDGLIAAFAGFTTDTAPYLRLDSGSYFGTAVGSWTLTSLMTTPPVHGDTVDVVFRCVGNDITLYSIAVNAATAEVINSTITLTGADAASYGAGSTATNYGLFSNDRNDGVDPVWKSFKVSSIPPPPATTVYVEHDFTATTAGNLTTVAPTTDELGLGWVNGFSVELFVFSGDGSGVSVNSSVANRYALVETDGREDVQVTLTLKLDRRLDTEWQGICLRGYATQVQQTVGIAFLGPATDPDLGVFEKTTTNGTALSTWDLSALMTTPPVNGDTVEVVMRCSGNNITLYSIAVNGASAEVIDSNYVITVANQADLGAGSGADRYGIVDHNRTQTGERFEYFKVESIPE